MTVREPKRPKACASSQPTRAPADHEQAGRQRRQVEDRLVGQEARFGQSWNRRQPGARSGRDQRFPESQGGAVDVDRIAAREARRAEEHVDSFRREARCRVDPAQTRADAPHALHGHRKIDPDAVGGVDAVACGIAHLGVQARAADEGLGRHAAVVQRVAAEQVAFDQRDPGAERGGAARRDQSRRSGADDQQVVRLARPRIAPIRWPQAVAKRAVVKGLCRAARGADGPAASVWLLRAYNQPPRNPARRRPLLM